MYKLLAIFLFLLVSIIFLIQTSQLKLSDEQTSLKSSNISEKTYTPKTPTLDQIFVEDHNWIQDLPKEKLRTIIATGDIIPARSVNFQATLRKDFTWPYLKTVEILKTADLTFINLETPLTGNCPPTNEGMIFCGDARNIEGLTFAGVDIASLANNHAGNYGVEGVRETVNLLNKNGIATTGVDNVKTLDVKGLKFAFLGYNDITSPQPGISNVEDEKIKREISYAKKTADVVIVAFHWGTEYVSQPSERQKSLAHLAIDSGADLIVGNHPHWIQPVEVYEDKLITYAHGNFIFDQEWSQKTKQGVIGKYTFYEKQLIDAEFTPILIEEFGQPGILKDLEGQKIIAEMKRESLKISASKKTN